jgi:hypothetical protein
MTLEKFEQECTFEILEDTKSVPKHILDQVQPGELLVVGETLNSNFLPKKWLDVLAKDSKNQRVLWRHKDPENPEVRGHVYGRIIEESVIPYGDEEYKIKSYNRIFNGPDGSPQKDLQEYLIKAKPKDSGWSKGFIVNRAKNGDIYRVFSLENSVTFKPACKRCKTQEVIQMESKEEYEIRIKELQTKLNDAHLQLEAKDTALTALEARVGKIDTLLASKDDEKLSLEDKVIGLIDQLKSFETKFEFMQVKPIIDQLRELEDPEVFKFYEDGKSRDEAWLIARLEKKKKEKTGAAASVVTKTLDEESKEQNEGDDKPKKLGLEVFRNNPALLKKIGAMKAEDAKIGLETHEGAWY